MKVICVDDEALAIKHMVDVCRLIPEFDDVQPFIWSEDALEYVQDRCNTVDIAFLDIDMPVINGILLAKEIKTVSPDTVIIFITGYSEYALDAYKINAFGYLMKPITKQEIEDQLKKLDDLKKVAVYTKKVCFRTFGNFQVLLDGKPIEFKRNKSREILAYLVDRMGTGASRPEIAAVLWEEGDYTRERQNELNSYIIELKKTLKSYGIEDVLLKERGRFQINLPRVNCDMYRFLSGDVQVINSFRGEYMSEYAWANFTEAILTQKADQQNN